MRIGWIAMRVSARPGRSRARQDGTWTPVLLARAVAIGIAAVAGCSSSSKPACAASPGTSWSGCCCFRSSSGTIAPRDFTRYITQMKSENRFQPSRRPSSRARATAWLRVVAPSFR
jgi:hypothetical protein